mmetsp:Transcript_21261/g.56281  ORF Transcript_21261/g.56281 Transcript_21261/m.56281 type:complete len:437 (+) Transcript_21261:863-2173(+)
MDAVHAELRAGHQAGAGDLLQGRLRGHAGHGACPRLQALRQHLDPPGGRERARRRGREPDAQQPGRLPLPRRGTPDREVLRPRDRLRRQDQEDGPAAEHRRHRVQLPHLHVRLRRDFGVQPVGCSHLRDPSGGRHDPRGQRDGQVRLRDQRPVRAGAGGEDAGGGPGRLRGHLHRLGRERPEHAQDRGQEREPDVPFDLRVAGDRQRAQRVLGGHGVRPDHPAPQRARVPRPHAAEEQLDAGGAREQGHLRAGPELPAVLGRVRGDRGGRGGTEGRDDHDGAGDQRGRGGHGHRPVHLVGQGHPAPRLRLLERGRQPEHHAGPGLGAAAQREGRHHVDRHGRDGGQRPSCVEVCVLGDPFPGRQYPRERAVHVPLDDARRAGGLPVPVHAGVPRGQQRRRPQRDPLGEAGDGGLHDEQQPRRREVHCWRHALRVRV